MSPILTSQAIERVDRKRNRGGGPFDEASSRSDITATPVTRPAPVGGKVGTQPMVVIVSDNRAEQLQRSLGGRLARERTSASSMLLAAVAAAGLGATEPAGANAHAYRHTCGTLLAAEGTLVRDLQGLMGHAPVTTRDTWTRSHGTGKPQQRPTPPCATCGRPSPSLDLVRPVVGTRLVGGLKKQSACSTTR